MALLPLDAGAVKLTIAVPAAGPAETLTPVGEPGAVPLSPPQAARDMVRASIKNIFILIRVLLGQLFASICVEANIALNKRADLKNLKLISGGHPFRRGLGRLATPVLEPLSIRDRTLPLDGPGHSLAEMTDQKFIIYTLCER